MSLFLFFIVDTQYLTLTHNFTTRSLFSGLNILILFMLVQIFLPFNRFLDMAIALIAVIIFSFYIIFDTYLIFNQLSPEDYIPAALNLYLDIINLFLRVLQILGSLQRD